MEKLLITGGAGYIGSMLCNELLKDNINITVLDNLIYKQHGIIEFCNNPNFNFIYGDVRDESLYKKLINSHDIIINLAAYVGPVCYKFPNESKQVNEDSCRFLANNSSKDQLIIYPNSNSGYGLGQHVDGKAVFCTEESPLNPISIYGETKTNGEKYLMNSGKNNTITYRLATLFGVSKKLRMDLIVNDFIWRAWNDKFIVLFEANFLRNFIHIKDVVNTIKFSIVNQNKMVGNVYNVGNKDLNMSKMDLCLYIKKYIPDFYITTSEFNKDKDQRNYIVSNDKLEKLGWGCSYSLDNGIKEILGACPIIKNASTIFSNI